MSRRIRTTEFVTAEEAVSFVEDGQTLMVEGSGGGVVEPDLLLDALGRRFKDTGSPRDITLINTTGIGDRKGAGLDRLAQPGLVRRAIAGNWGMAPEMSRMAVAGTFEAYNFPQGVMAQMCREIAAGRPGVITHVGVGTFCDPRVEGGKLNDRTTEDLVDVVKLGGAEWLHYRPVPPDVCFIRGTTADEDGNLSLEHEGARLEVLAMAQATRNSGGLVIAQVKRKAKRGTLDTRTVVVPGMLVDLVVVHPTQRQTVESEYNPAFSGEIKASMSGLPPMPLSDRKVIGRRAFQEIRRGDVVNLGVGMPDGVAAVAAEEDCFDAFTLTIEQGLVGGVPAPGVIFGVSYNPIAILDQPAQFDFYDGGGLDIAFLGFAQLDRDGNVNVSRFGSRLIGTGGFVNITQNASTVVFCGTFTSGGLRTQPARGALAVVQEGGQRKLVERVEQITFNGAVAQRRGQRVLVVTERAVLELGADGLEVVELAPGVDLERDVLEQAGFPLRVQEPRMMEPALFNQEPLGWDVPAPSVEIGV